MTFQININNRNYTDWVVEPIFDMFSLQPLEHKLFSKDTFDLDHNKNIKLIYSPVRSGNPIAAVLILLGNKTFGRKNTKLLYKCIPNDPSLPIFLVPYEMKNVGFSKVFKNIYVSISFYEWTDKHPMAIIQNIIGPINDLPSFYEYQLHCKQLNHSINKFQKYVSKTLASKPQNAFIENITQRYTSIQDRTGDNWHIFSIDPANSLDFDDAFSIQENAQNIKIISIYISNVSIWADILNLWDSFSLRVSSIYLPDKKRPMMPAALSDGICSLQQNVTRIALVMDIFIENDVTITKIEFSNAFIKVFKNYSYEEPGLLTNANYNNLLYTTKQITHLYPSLNEIDKQCKDSHELVSFLMILMNYHCACELANTGKGIYRTTALSTNSTVPKFKFSGNYSISPVNLNHDALGLNAYVHITSPIRRIVDLLNIIAFQHHVMKSIKLSENANAFYNKWAADLEYINISMRAIKKVQSDCELLNICTNNPELLTNSLDGYLLEFIERNNNNLLCYRVYLPSLKLFSQTYIPKEQIPNININIIQKFKLYLFQDEERFKKKIRVTII
jgi:exoribonuclease R